MMTTLLVLMGAMCPHCAFGTRITSKRWATCKQCGLKVRRRNEAEIDEMAHRVRLRNILAQLPLGPKFGPRGMK